MPPNEARVRKDLEHLRQITQSVGRFEDPLKSRLKILLGLKYALAVVERHRAWLRRTPRVEGRNITEHVEPCGAAEAIGFKANRLARTVRRKVVDRHHLWHHFIPLLHAVLRNQ